MTQKNAELSKTIEQLAEYEAFLKELAEPQKKRSSSLLRQRGAEILARSEGIDKEAARSAHQGERAAKAKPPTRKAPEKAPEKTPEQQAAEKRTAKSGSFWPNTRPLIRIHTQRSMGGCAGREIPAPRIQGQRVSEAENGKRETCRRTGGRAEEQ
jgi:hypothetical protein